MTKSIFRIRAAATQLPGLVLLATMLSAVQGCAATTGDEASMFDEQVGPVGGLSSPLLNGTQMPIRGLISMIAPDNTTCGGLMLNSRTIVTSGHCVVYNMTQYDQQLNMRIAYWRPSDGAKLCIAGTTNASGFCAVGAPVMVHVNPNYTTRYDYDDDMAVLISPTPWAGISGTADYSYIFVSYLHTLGTLGKLNPPRPIAVAGTGPQDNNNNGNTVPNYIQTPNAYLGWTATAYNILASDFPVCAGDSGGPILSPRDSSNTPMAVGLGSSPLLPDGTNPLVPGHICTNRSDVHVYYTSLGAKLNWINTFSTSPLRTQNMISTVTYAYFF